MTDRTRLYFGDCLDGLERLGAGLATLAYLDPPFSVGTDFRARLRGGEVRAHGKATSGRVAYEDRFDSLDVFLGWLGERISRLRDVLSEEGSMWVHLDHRAIHETKVLCDRIFGRDQFLGEVIWTPGNGAKGRRKPSVTHQTLLIYAKGRDFVWNADAPELREPFAPTSLSMHFTNIDDSGRRYRERSVGGKSYRYYADEGRAMGSVWTDCPAMQCNTPLRKETTGYPTQKPLRLLERIVCASSRPGDLVVDPFCGSGTTLLAALEQGRLAFGCDVGELAVQISSNRIESHGYRVSVLRPRKGTVRSLGASRALPRV